MFSKRILFYFETLRLRFPGFKVCVDSRGVDKRVAGALKWRNVSFLTAYFPDFLRVLVEMVRTEPG